jgi:oligoribonuclease
MTAFTRGLHEIGDGLFAWLQPDGGWGWSNAGLIVEGRPGDGAAALVDTLFDTQLTAEMLAGMDNWNKSTHGKSGLIDKVRASVLTEQQAEQQMLAFLQQHVPKAVSPMCGNSICQDRRFMARWMPQLEAYFHYRNLDVSTLKELARRWRPELVKGMVKHGKHEALADIHESIEELRYYREHFLRMPDPAAVPIAAAP